MNFVITKLDRRHAWQDQFSHMIEFHRIKDFNRHNSSGVLEFDRCRQWFNETWAWSQDMETRDEIKKSMLLQGTWWPDCVNQHWSYSIRYNEYRIYVNQPALTMFGLRWSGHVSV